jgi:hypothetical protein
VTEFSIHKGGLTMADSNQVDEKVVRRLMNKIIIQENRNNKSRAKSDSQMVTEIKKMIEEEVKCLSNQ